MGLAMGFQRGPRDLGVWFEVSCSSGHSQLQLGSEKMGREPLSLFSSGISVKVNFYFGNSKPLCSVEVPS